MHRQNRKCLVVQVVHRVHHVGAFWHNVGALLHHCGAMLYICTVIQALMHGGYALIKAMMYSLVIVLHYCLKNRHYFVGKQSNKLFLNQLSLSS
jgi:hypothetical protein